MMFSRLSKPILSNSFFLFGPRGTGKSTFVRDLFRGHDTLLFDLLDADLEERFQKSPKDLSYELEQARARSRKPEWVIIDEIQKVPKLLDTVHSEIEQFGTRFALTGSSARKLKLGAANLLGGRAFVNNLHPLTHLELGSEFSLEAVMAWGSLPKIYQLTVEREKRAFLKAYAQTYLKEEVWGEQLVRKIEPFRKFLEIAALSNGQIVNFNKIAHDTGVDDKTVKNYFSILEDTLLGFLLPGYDRSVRKQQTQAPKFYFFDTGVQRSLAGLTSVPLVDRTYAYGKTFEHVVLLEAWRLNEYFETDFKFSYLRTKDDAEIDLIVERPGQPAALIEIKSTTHVTSSDVRTLNSFKGDFTDPLLLCLSRDPKSKIIGDAQCMEWREGLHVLFGELALAGQ